MSTTTEEAIVAYVEEKIMDMICSGGGDEETINELAKEIVAQLKEWL